MAYQGQPPTCGVRMTPKLIGQLQRLSNEVFVHPNYYNTYTLARYTAPSSPELGVSQEPA